MDPKSPGKVKVFFALKKYMEAIATITPKKYQGNAGLYSIQDSFELDLTTMRFGGDDWTPNLLII